MKRFLTSLAVISCLLLLIPFLTNAQSSNIRYRIEDLGALPGENPANETLGYCINSIGQVCGAAQTNLGNYVPFRWTNGTMQNLGSLGGVNSSDSVAREMNDFGWVTGTLKNAAGETRAYLHNNSALIDLGIGTTGFPAGGTRTEAGGINNRGEVVGVQWGEGSRGVGFYYDGTTLRNANSLLPANSGWIIDSVRDINDNRQIVGTGRLNGSFSDSIYRFDLRNNNIISVYQSNPPNNSGYPIAMNNLGTIVGIQSNHPFTFAFTYSDAQIISDLQTGATCYIITFVSDVNTRGAIIGGYANAGQPPGGCQMEPHSRLLLWMPNGERRILNDSIDPSLGWTLKGVSQINDRGQIVGTASRVVNGVSVTRAVRLTPIRPDSNQVSDFDGDGRTDLAVYRPNGGFWYHLRSSNNSFNGAQFGISTDKIAPGDFDGDGRTDLAVYRDGTWFILQSSNGAFRAVQFGISEDVPQAADFDADGKTDIAVFRPSNGYWYVLRSSDNVFVPQQFGQAGDKPVVGDYDGDARADFAVFRPSVGVWFVLQSTLGFRAAYLGSASDRLVQGDYDGDGRTDFAVYRPSEGNWYLLRSRDGLLIAQFGISTDEPVPGDYDGDGIFDIAVNRSGTWFIQQTSSGFRATQFGNSADKPVPATYIPSAN